MSSHFLVLNRISALGKQTAGIIRDMGYFNVAHVNGTRNALERIGSTEGKLILIMELTAASTVIELDFLKSICRKIPVIVTSPVVEKDYIVEAAKMGVKNFIIKTSDNECFSRKLKGIVDAIMSGADPVYSA